MTSIPPVSGALLAVLVVYSAIRFERLDEIWDEKENYERKLKRELSDYLFETASLFEQKFHEEIDNMLPDPSSDEINIPQQDGGEIDTEAANTEFPSWEDLDGVVPSLEIIIGNMQSSLADIFDVDNISELDRSEPLHVKYMIEQQGIDPDEIFEDIRELNQRYNRPGTAMAILKSFLMASLLFHAVLFIVAVLNFEIPANLLYIYSGVIFGWICSELYLWKVLNEEVEVDGRTPVKKFLAPDPRELI